MLVVLIIVLSFSSPYFFSIDNFITVLNSVSPILLVSVGMTMLLVLGCIDLSVGSVMAASGAVCCAIMKLGAPVWSAILAGICTGLAFGAINGFFSTKGGINPFIVTIGTMNIGRGLTYVLIPGIGIGDLPKPFTVFGQTEFFHGMEYPVIISVIVVIIAWYYLKYTKAGRTFYFIGGSDINARLLGFNVNSIKFFTFLSTSLLAAIAGIIQASRFGSASNQTGIGIELQVILSAVLGGVSMNGGEGGILGGILGVFFLYFIYNGFNLLRVDVYWKDFVMGFILIAAVLLNTFREKRKTIDIRRI